MFILTKTESKPRLGSLEWFTQGSQWWKLFHASHDLNPRPHVHKYRDLMERATRDLGIRQSDEDPVVERGYFRRFNARYPFRALYNPVDSPHHSSANTCIVFPRIIIWMNLFQRSGSSIRYSYAPPNSIYLTRACRCFLCLNWSIATFLIFIVYFFSFKSVLHWFQGLCVL